MCGVFSQVGGYGVFRDRTGQVEVVQRQGRWGVWGAQGHDRWCRQFQVLHHPSTCKPDALCWLNMHHAVKAHMPAAPQHTCPPLTLAASHPMSLLLQIGELQEMVGWLTNLQHFIKDAAVNPTPRELPVGLLDPKVEG